MKLDAELMFECLIYLNMYYYPVLAISDSIMAVAKWQSVVYTPHIHYDSGVVIAVLVAEILKILLYEKYKNERRDLITAVAVFLTCITLFGVFYTLFFQQPVIKLEYILCAMTMALAGTQVLFGVLQLMPCLKKKAWQENVQ